MAESSALMSPPSNINIANTKNSARASLSPLRNKPIGRASTFADTSTPLRHRRSSTFSDSIISSTDDLLLPRAKSSGLESQLEHSHWHSAPLALALLPAVGGLLFKNGGSVLTDVTLLGLAAVFLNWSVRLPWDWYYSTQSKRAEEAPGLDVDFSDTIIEEGSDDEQGSKSPSPTAMGAEKKSKSNENEAERSRLQRDSTSELRIHELLALFSCFVFPAVGAWLLHTIRSQLSRPSEGLVSNYNLTIFLLASELRPISHLIKMIQARTLYLQRTLNTSTTAGDSPPSSTIRDLTSRLNDLEAHVAAAANTATNPSSPPTTAQLTTEVRKYIQPDLDALNRAVRRYEKRATLLTMQTESRLQDLEARMSDAITLAAAAERSSYSKTSRRGSAFVLLDWICAAVVLPVQAAWTVASLPAKVASTALGVAEGYVGRKVRRELRDRKSVV